MEKIKILELFSGYGSQKLALDYLGIPCESTQCEIDKYAVDAYNQIHGETGNLGDICKVDETKLPYYDLITYSSPCFTKDSLVLTEFGYKQINELVVDSDKVITHTNKYQLVKNVSLTGKKEIISIKGMGVDEIKCTPNHKFFVREKKYNWQNKRRIKTITKPQWVEAQLLKKGMYLGIAVNNKSIIPEWNGIQFEWKDGRKTRHKNDLSPLMQNIDFWWLIGRYIGDGWFNKENGIIICCAKEELSEIIEKLKRLPFHYSITEERTVNKIKISLKELVLFVSQFGKGASNKKLTNTIIDLPKHLLKQFLNGYFSADGCFYKKQNLIACSTVSRELVYGIAECCVKVYERPYRIYKNKRNEKTVIEGRLVNQKDDYIFRMKLTESNRDSAFYENGYVWTPFKSAVECGEDWVYDIEVEKDHSFTVQNIIVHNCQDFSVAGLQKGGDKDSGTRSSLLWECERIIRAVKPKYLLMENVKNLVGKQHKHNFIAWLDTLDALGYNNYWQVLNAKDYGVPQNRERVFVVSIRKDIQQGYTFPEKIPLEKRLKDILEDSVEEKYYLSDRMVNFFIKNSEDNAKKGNGFRFTPQFGETYARAVTTNAGSRMDDNFIKEPICASSRGRNPENPSDRTAGIYLEQTLEFNKDGCTNTLTTVQKDNYIVEPKIIQRGHGFNKGGEFEEAPTITANGKYQENNFIVEPLAYDEQNGYIRQDGCVGTLTTDGSSPKHNNRVIEPNVIQLGNIVETGNWDNPQRGRIYSADGCSPALNTMQGGGLEPKILESYVEKQYNKFIDENGYVPEFFNPYNCNEIEDVAPTLTAQGDSVTKSSTVLKSENYRIRKLTPRECWRLMGVKDEDFNKLHDISNTQLYKMAGNSIVADVLVAIFRNLFINKTEYVKKGNLFNL